MPDNSQDQTNKVNTMTRTEMEKSDAFVSYPTGIIMGEDGFPLLNKIGQQQFMDLSEEEITSDLKQELKRLFIKEYEDYITDNDLVSIREIYGYGKYMSVDGYIDEAEKNLADTNTGVIENYLQNQIHALDDMYEKNEVYRIDETNKPYENYIENKIQLQFGEYIDPNGNIKLSDGREVSLSRLISLTKDQVIDKFLDRSEILNEEAEIVNVKFPLKGDVEIPLSQNPEEWIERLNSDDITIDEKRALYAEIQSSAEHSERNLVSLAMLPVAQSLAFGEIKTDTDPSFKAQMRMAISIVNNDLLVGIIPDYVKTAVLSMDTASRLQKSINDKKNAPAENGVSYEVSNIIWDADDMDDVSRLSTSMIVSVPSKIIDEEDIEDYIANYITDEKGFTHDGFSSSRMGEAYDKELQRQTGLADNWTADDANGFQHDDISSDTIDGLMDAIEAWYHDDKTRDDYQNELEAHIIDDTITIGTYMFSLYDKEKQPVEDIFAAKEAEEYISPRLLKNATISSAIIETIEMARDNLEVITTLYKDLKTYNSRKEMNDIAEQLINAVENPIVSNGVSEFSGEQIIDRINKDFALRPYMFIDTLVTETSIHIFNSIEEADFIVNNLRSDGYSESSIKNFLDSLADQVEMLGDQPGADYTAYEVLHHLEALSFGEVDDEVMDILKERTQKVITADINLFRYFDPSMSEEEMTIEIENIELPHGYKEDSFKSPTYETASKTTNQKTKATVGIQVEFVVGINETHESIVKIVDQYCEINIGKNAFAVTGDYKKLYDIEQSFEKPWHEYHAATRPTKQQMTKAIDALKDLKIEAAKNNPSTLITLASLYESGVRPEFKKELFDSKDVSTEDRIKLSESMLKLAQNEGSEEAKLKFLNSRYERARDLQNGTFYNPEEIFEILLENADSGHVPSMLAVAEMYRSGAGVDSSSKDEEKWHLLAKAGLDSGKVVYNKNQAKKQKSSTGSKKSINKNRQ